MENKLNDSDQYKLASLRKHRRRYSMNTAQTRTPGGFLWRLTDHMIFAALLALLLLGPNFSQRQQRPAAVEALKLPAFLSSWIPQASQQQQLQQEEPLVVSDSYLVAFADQQQLSAGGASASNSELPTQMSSADAQAQRQRNANSFSGASLKRPFQSMLSVGGKHSTGGHLFSVLPRSLFGRILGQQQTSTTPSLIAKQQQQQLLMMGNKYAAANPNTPMLWPFSHHQQFGLNHAQSMLPSGQFRGHNQQQQQQLNYNKQLAAFSPLPSNQQMKFGGGGDVQQTSQSLRQQSADFVTSLLPPNNHPITSFRPTVTANSVSLPQGNATTSSSPSQREQLLASEKKHALGYGESDDDFVIENAQQVPELQQLQQQAAGPHPTRHPSDEYREMPAIVIADPELLGPSESLQANASFNHSENQRLNVSLAFESGSQQQQEFVGDLVKLGSPSSELATSNKTTDGANGTLATTKQTLDQSAQLVSLASTNSTYEPSISEATRKNVTSPVGETEERPGLDKQNVSLPIEQLAQSASSQLQHLDSPESNRQESAAQAMVVVPSNGIGQQQQTGLSQQQQEHQEQMESFIIGPYKGLTLGPDEPNLGQSHSQMEFIDHDQPLGNFMAPSSFRPQMVQQQQSPSAGHNLIGSASSLLQQARQLIQLPFTHLPHNAHLHQQQRPVASNFGYLQTASQQMASATNSRSFARPPPQNLWQQQQNVILAQKQPQPHYFPDSPLHQAAMNRPQLNIKPAHQSRPFGMTPPTGQSQQATYFLDHVEQMPQSNFGMHQANSVQSQQMFRPAIGFNGNNHQMMPHGAQYFMDVQQQQQVRHQVPLSYEQARQLDATGDFSQMLANSTSSQSQVKRAPKSGLYQIEPPKLEQTKLSVDGDEPQQQQKIEVQENSNELGEESSNESDDDDDDEDSPQQQQQERIPQDEQPQQQAQSVSEPILASNKSAQPSNQILQVGASFGVVTATNGSSSVANQTQERRGQVFNEPLGQLGTGSQLAAVQPQQNAVDYDLRLVNQPQPSSGQNLLDTQVYTLPYTVSMYQNAQQQEATFVPQPQVPRYMHPEVRLPSHVPQVSNWQQQRQQQMPITFITTSSQDLQQHQMMPPRQRQASWSSFKRPFGQRPPQTRMMQQSSRPSNHVDQVDEYQQRFKYAAASSHIPQIKQQQQYFHYQPLAMELNNNAIQQQQQQFAFALQHQPGGNELHMRQFQSQQPQVLVTENTTGNQDVSTTTAALSPGGSQTVEFGKAQDSVSVEPMTSDSTTTPSTIVVDASQEADLNQQQQQSQSIDSDRKSVQEQQQSRDQNSIDDDQQAGQRKSSISQSRQQAQQQQARSPSGFCAGRTPGLYADIEQRCKAYYQCAPTGHQMFRCNNQTQFNQKTQNCDWWYNVDCGGRLGSPEDFEQAASNPRTRVASQMSDFVQVTPMTQLTSTTTTATLTPASPVATTSTESHPQLSRSESQDQIRSFVESPSSSTRAFYTTTMTSASIGSTALQNLSSASSSGDQEFSSQTQLSDRGISSTTPQTMTTASSSSLDQQQDASDQHSSAGFGSTSSTPTSSSADTLIETVASNSAESQPRVGAAPNEETTTTTTSASSPSSSMTLQQLDGDDELNSQQQPANEPQTKSRRLIQSEFGGSSKTARAIPGRKAAEEARQQEPGTNQDQVIYATSSNQGSISYDPQSLPLQQQQQRPRSLDTSELAVMTPSSTVSLSNNNKDESPPASRTGKMERRFGARLPPKKP